MTECNMVTVTYPVSLEYLALMAGDDWARREKSRTETPPSQEEMRDYEHACDLLEQLRLYDGFYEGGPDEGASVEKPRAKVHIEWAETESEWRARIAEKARAEGNPERPTYNFTGMVGPALVNALDRSTMFGMFGNDAAFRRDQG